ncbi:MAG: formylglycine-generating enzyme family protein [Kiritimatiellae bacterium]|nr:formylglycine-generating enzyme family protein [Kiritimatiellia bacterium]
MSNAKSILANLVFAFAVSVNAAPEVSNVKFLQDSVSSRKVTIMYDLETEPGIITVDIITNGVSIGEKHLTCFAGDVNRVVEPGKAKTIYWYPDKAWPDNKSDNAKAVVTAWAVNAPPNYMVVNLTDGVTSYYTSEECLPDGGLANDVYRTERMVFRKIPARGVTWRMGSPEGELGRYKNEKPHLVTLTKDYWFCIFPVTMGQHKIIDNINSEFAPSYCFFTNTACHLTRPVQGIGMKSLRGSVKLWPADGHEVDDGTSISRFRAIAGNRPFDLPTEAQWEYAARAGVGTALTTGRNLNVTNKDPQLDKLGRYDRNNGSGDSDKLDAPIRANDDSTGTSKVGIYEPNRWGIYDIHGNVADLCLDWYGEYTGDMESVQEDPKGLPKAVSSECTLRGGFWGFRSGSSAAECRLACRHGTVFDTNKAITFRIVGYRLCLEIQ